MCFLKFYHIFWVLAVTFIVASGAPALLQKNGTKCIENLKQIILNSARSGKLGKSCRLSETKCPKICNTCRRQSAPEPAPLLSQHNGSIVLNFLTQNSENLRVANICRFVLDFLTQMDQNISTRARCCRISETKPIKICNASCLPNN